MLLCTFIVYVNNTKTINIVIKLIFVDFRSVFQTQWAVDYFKLKEKAMAYASELSANGMEMVRDRLSDVLGMAKSGFTMWEPAIGDFGYSLTLPFRMVDLQSMPQLSIDMANYVAELKDYISSQFPLAPAGADWTMADIYYMYKPSADIISWVPPFSGWSRDKHMSIQISRFLKCSASQEPNAHYLFNQHCHSI